jgi:hypothetical protein
VLADLVPLDRRRVVDPTGVLRGRLPWVEGVEAGTTGADCMVVSDLESEPDVDARLKDIREALNDDGMLLTAIPSGARGPRHGAAGWLWRTAPHDVARRLEAAGFHDVAIDEVDAFRTLGAPPCPASEDRLMLVRAWPAPQDRAAQLLAAVHRRLDPSENHASDDPLAVLAGGHAWCSGYTLTLGEALLREDHGVEWVSMLARGHPRGRGTDGVETHEVLQVTLPDGRVEVHDPMAGVRFAHPLADLLRSPSLAQAEPVLEARYRERGYDLYATEQWYGRVTGVSVKRHPQDVLRYRPLRDHLAGPTGRPARRPAGARASAAATPAIRLRWLAHRAQRRVRRVAG